jgi:hypothetical protein
LALFTGDVASFLKEVLPTAVSRGVSLPCWGDNHSPPYAWPPDEPRAINLVWPIPRQGLMLLIQLAQNSSANELISGYPWVSEGVQHGILIEKVYPWCNGFEAQIEGIVNGMTITFFDALFSQHRAFYQYKKHYQFILSGFAYSCKVIDPQPVIITDPVAIRAMKQAERKDEPDLSPIHIQTKGMTALIPIEKWDRDDYQFQAPVKTVAETELLGQKSWRIRATVLRSIDDNSDIDLDIYVTEKILKEGKVPEPGDDIAGALWLQGYLWYPNDFMHNS